jgi:L-ascorbate metabolism protein UlaG (beta-lactamase superfamily)
MKITKFVHSCLLVEMPAPVSRTVLFDPGIMSEAALQVEKLQFLDDIVITHKHSDHLSVPLVKQLVGAFPEVSITAPAEVVELLAAEGIPAHSEPAEGMELFTSPHESVAPLFTQPEQIGVHYLDVFTNPGDSHSFNSSKKILALPVTAPWGSTIEAVKLAVKLKPQYVLPIHDWHYNDVARDQMYQILTEALAKEGITFIALKTGEPVVLET